MHAAQGRIDVDFEDFGNLLEGISAVMPHDHDFPLFRGNAVQQLAHPLMPLFAHHGLVRIGGRMGQGVEHAVFLRIPPHGHVLFSPEMIDHEVVRDTERPRQKFSLLIVPTFPDARDDFQEGILEDVFAELLVTYKEKDGRENFLLVAPDQFGHGRLAAALVMMDEFLVTQEVMLLHRDICLK